MGTAVVSPAGQLLPSAPTVVPLRLASTVTSPRPTPVPPAVTSSVLVPPVPEIPRDEGIEGVGTRSARKEIRQFRVSLFGEEKNFQDQLHVYRSVYRLYNKK